MNFSYIKIKNFHDDPMAARKHALETNYEEDGVKNYPGVDGFSNNMYDDKAEDLIRIIGEPCISWADGNYRSSKHNDVALRHIHTDAMSYTTIVSLTLDDNPHGPVQTALWRHKETGLTEVGMTEVMNHEVNWEHIIRDEGTDEDKWEVASLITLNFNEAVIIDANQFHSPYPQGFGDTLENSRLTQNFFLNRILGK